MSVLERTEQAYSPDEARPLRGYLTTMTTFGGVIAGLTALHRALGRPPPERVSTSDVVLISIATHKLSRILAKDAVTSPLRAPFTRYQAPAGAAELNEVVRHSGGVRHAVGELVTCPFCMAAWVATGLTAGLAFAPRFTRLVATAGTAVAAADFLHLAYDAVKKRA